MRIDESKMQFLPLDWQVNDTADVNADSFALMIDANSTDPILRQLSEIIPICEIGPEAGFTLYEDNALGYPGLPPLQPGARATHLGEQIFLYPAGFVVVLQLNGQFMLFRRP